MNVNSLPQQGYMYKNKNNILGDTESFGYQEIESIQNEIVKSPFKPKGFNVDVKNPLVSALEKESNMTLTENGAPTNISTLNNLLDFFGNGAALRTRSENKIVKLFSRAFSEDKLLALKTLFFIRDIRGGSGERRTFRIILNWLSKNYPDIVLKNIKNVPYYGRYDDLYSLFGTYNEVNAMKFISNQLKEDWNNMRNGKPVSLCAKWLKSTNTSSKESKRLGNLTAKYLNWSHKKYRKTLSKLRSYIDVVEVKMCNGDFDKINFEKVPSKASLIYRNSFKKHVPSIYDEYLNKVERGEAKINSSTLYPYDIIQSLTASPTGIRTSDLQWKSLPNYVQNCGKSICVCDVSGSMSGLPMVISISLGIYFAERNEGPFKDVFITFSNKPKFHRIIGNNIYEKYINFNRSGWGMNTNLISVFKLILKTAINNDIKQKDLPERILIISDMEFDECSSGNNTNFQEIDKMYKEAGYKRPSIVFWNVNSTNNNNPILSNDSNVCLVSGSSPSVLKYVLGEKVLNPIDVMMKALNDKRYDSVVI